MAQVLPVLVTILVFVVLHLLLTQNINAQPASVSIDEFATTVAKIEVAKAEVPITEASKVEAPKPKAPIVEVLKTEVPKIEEPKIEVPIVEAPKSEEPKFEVQKIEEPKIEVPIIEEPKIQVPIIKEPKIQIPVIEEPKIVVPIIDASKIEEPNTEAPATEAPKTEVPVTEALNTEVPKIESSNTEVPVAEAPNTEAPKAEPPTPVELVGRDSAGAGNSFSNYEKRIQEALQGIRNQFRNQTASMLANKNNRYPSSSLGLGGFLDLPGSKSNSTKTRTHLRPPKPVNYKDWVNNRQHKPSARVAREFLPESIIRAKEATRPIPLPLNNQKFLKHRPSSCPPQWPASAKKFGLDSLLPPAA